MSCCASVSDLITADDLETDPSLGLQVEEPDSWTPTVGKEVSFVVQLCVFGHRFCSEVCSTFDRVNRWFRFDLEFSLYCVNIVG